MEVDGTISHKVNLMKNRILYQWNWMRIVRLAIGGYGLTQGIMHSESLMIGIGAFFLIQGILNFGCNSCSTGNCEVKPNNNEIKKLDS
jgi:hypothetical protein